MHGSSAASGARLRNFSRSKRDKASQIELKIPLICWHRRAMFNFMHLNVMFLSSTITLSERDVILERI